MAEWGVTALEATGEIDGGAVWATRTFRTREAGKSILYRHEVRRAAIDAVIEAVTDVAAGTRAPVPVDYGEPGVTGPAAPVDPAAGPRNRLERGFDGDREPSQPRRGGPPRRARCGGRVPFHLFGAHSEGTLRAPGEIVAQRHGAIWRATVDGAVWITTSSAPATSSFPAARALAVAGHELDVPELVDGEQLVAHVAAGPAQLGNPDLTPALGPLVLDGVHQPQPRAARPARGRRRQQQPPRRPRPRPGPGREEHFVVARRRVDFG